MNIFQRFLSALPLVSSIAKPSRQAAHYERYRAIKRGSFNKNKALLNSTYFTCTNIIANTIAKNKIYVYKIDDDGRKVKATDHRWFDSLAYNPYQSLSSHKVISSLYTNTYSNGMGFLFIKEFDNNLNTVNELVPVCKPVDDVRRIEGEIYYKFKDQETWIPSKSLIVNYVISNDGGVTGIHPVDAAANELTIQKMGENAYTSFLDQGLQGLLFFQPQMGLSPVDKAKFAEKQEQLVNDFMGFHNAGKIPTIPNGYDLKQLSAQQLDYLQHNKYTVSQIGALMGVPEVLLGSVNTTTIGKAEEQILFFKNFTLSNVASLLIQDLNVKLLTKEERAAGYTIEFDWSGLYEADIITKANMASTLAQRGALSPNEIREAFGHTKILNEFMDGYYIQSQNQNVLMYDKWMNNSVNKTNQNQPDTEQ